LARPRNPRPDARVICYTVAMLSSPAEQTPELTRIPSLDGLRALSIFLVVSLHTLQRYSIHHHVGLGWYALFNGGLGVSIFFVISGFLITSLLLQEQRKRGSISLRGFYLRRAFRILPPLYFYLGVVVLLGIVGRVDLNRSDIVSSAFFFHNFAENSTMWSVEHLWSISVEEQFYVVWPLILFACMRRQGIAGRFAAAAFPAFILAASPFARVFFGHQKNHLMHSIGVKYLNYDFLMFGCLVALLQHTPTFESIYQKATRVWWLPPAVIAVCSVLWARYENYFTLPIGYTLAGASIAVFLLWCKRNPSSVIGRALNWAPIVRIGVLSYSIYIWQTLFLHVQNSRVFAPLSFVGSFPANWLGFYALACFSYYVIEQPSLQLRRRLIGSLHIYAAKRQSARSGR
jgi:peptidoglycan/LPS O-acetylase OafA/YrhL